MSTFRWVATAGLAALALIAVVTAASGAPSTHRPLIKRAQAKRVVFFTSDGMRPDLMESFAKQGLMPEYKKLMAQGVRGQRSIRGHVVVSHRSTRRWSVRARKANRAACPGSPCARRAVASWR